MLFNSAKMIILPFPALRSRFFCDNRAEKAPVREDRSGVAAENGSVVQPVVGIRKV